MHAPTGATRLRPLAVALALALASPAGALPLAFVASESGPVDVVDLEGGTAAAPPVSGAPAGLVAVAALPDGFGALAVGAGAGIWRVDAAGAALVTGTGAIADALGIALAPNGRTALVTQRNGGVWAVQLAAGGASVDGAALTPVTLLPAASFANPTRAAFAPGGFKAYVAGDGAVAAVSLPQGGAPSVTEVSNAGGPAGLAGGTGVAVSQDGLLAAVVTRGGTVAFIDTSTDAVILSFSLGMAAGGLAFHPDDSRIYVSLPAAGAVAVVDVATLALRTVPTCASPEGISVSADGRRLVLACGTSIAVLDATTTPEAALGSVAAASARSYGAMAAPPLPIPSPGPLSLWRGEGNGFDALEATPNDLGATLGTPQYAPGRSGLGLRASGDDAWRTPSPADLPLANTARSVVAWVRAASLPASGSATVAAWGDPAAARAFALEVTAAGEVLWRGGNGTLASAPGLLALGAWHHLGATWDGATARLYLDGVATTAGPQAALDTALPPGGGFLWIASAPPGPGGPFDGTLDDVAVFSRALAANEVRSIAGAGAFQVPRLHAVFSAAPGGAVQGPLVQEVPRGGATLPVEALPSPHFHLDGWTGPGGFSSTDNPLVVSPLLAGNVTYQARFALDRIPIDFAVAGGGTLSGPASQTVEWGKPAAPVTAVPDPTWHFFRWEDVNGQLLGTQATLTIPAVTEPATYVALFARDTYLLSFAADPGGDLVGQTAQIVEHGSASAEVTAVAKPRFAFLRWEEATRGTVPSDVTLVVDPVTGPGVYTARFEQVLFPVNASARGASVLTPDPDGAIGQQVQVDFFVDFGFAFHHVEGTCGGQPGPIADRVLPILTDPLAGSCDLRAVFLPTGDPTPDGTVTPADVRALLLHLLGVATLSSDPRWLDVAPLSGALPAPDGLVSIGDAAVVARLAAGTIAW